MQKPITDAGPRGASASARSAAALAQSRMSSSRSIGTRVMRAGDVEERALRGRDAGERLERADGEPVGREPAEEILEERPQPHDVRDDDDRAPHRLVGRGGEDVDVDCRRSRPAPGPSGDLMPALLQDGHGRVSSVPRRRTRVARPTAPSATTASAGSPHVDEGHHPRPRRARGCGSAPSTCRDRAAPRRRRRCPCGAAGRCRASRARRRGTPFRASTLKKTPWMCIGCRRYDSLVKRTLLHVAERQLVASRAAVHAAVVLAPRSSGGRSRHPRRRGRDRTRRR